MEVPYRKIVRGICVKRIYLFFVLSTLAFAAIETTVSDIDGTSVRVEATEGLSKGASAFVLREFDGEHGTVIAQCTVKDPEKGVLECTPFDYLYHESLSLVQDGVKQGDKVVVGLLDGSVSIIAPNQKSYLAVKGLYEGAIVFHPDLLAVTLKYDDNPTPDKETFQTYCRENFIGVLAFALNDGIYEVDCLSFNVIGKRNEASLDKDNDKPFYHRVGEIERGFFDFSSEEVDDFTAYYKKMIGVK